MRNYRVIVRNFINGESKSLVDMGLDSNVKIIKVYTIIDEDLIHFKDWMIDQVALFHNDNVFVEDKVHDWDVRNGYFYFYGHSGRKGDIHNLILLCK